MDHPKIISDWLKLNSLEDKYGELASKLYSALLDESKVLKVLSILESTGSFCKCRNKNVN